MPNISLVPCPICGVPPTFLDSYDNRTHFAVYECLTHRKNPDDRHFVKALGRDETEARDRWNGKRKTSVDLNAG